MSQLQLHSRDATATTIQPPLPQAVGYVIVVVVGMIIATGMHLPSNEKGLY